MWNKKGYYIFYVLAFISFCSMIYYVGKGHGVVGSFLLTFLFLWLGYASNGKRK